MENLSLRENPRPLSFLLTFAIIGVVLWRNYDVIRVGQTIIPSNNKNAEQQELSRNIEEVGVIEEGQVITNTYGTYEFKDGRWVKTKELWNLFSQSI
jgi:hypothetical protein